MKIRDEEIKVRDKEKEEQKIAEEARINEQKRLEEVRINYERKELERLRAENELKLERERQDHRESEHAIYEYTEAMISLNMNRDFRKNPRLLSAAKRRTFNAFMRVLSKDKLRIIIMLIEDELIKKRPGLKPLISLKGADLSKINFEDFDDEFANLSFSGANLREANLKSKVFYGSDFSYTDLTGASFEDADLREVNLMGAKYDILELAKARSLRRATLQGLDGNPYINQGDTLDVLP